MQWLYMGPCTAEKIKRKKEKVVWYSCCLSTPALFTKPDWILSHDTSQQISDY